MGVADLAAELGEPLRVGDAQGRIAIGVAYVSSGYRPEHLLGDADDELAVAAGVGGTAGYRREQGRALGHEALEPARGEQVRRYHLVERPGERRAEGLALIGLGKSRELARQSRPQLPAQGVDHAGQDLVEISSQVQDSARILDPRHRVIGLLEGVLD
jgi:hypothetical protein